MEIAKLLSKLPSHYKITKVIPISPLPPYIVKMELYSKRYENNTNWLANHHLFAFKNYQKPGILNLIVYHVPITNEGIPFIKRYTSSIDTKSYYNHEYNIERPDYIIPAYNVEITFTGKHPVINYVERKRLKPDIDFRDIVLYK